MEPGTEIRMEQSFSERLKRYRKERNLTQQQQADAQGVSNKSVSRWESGGGYPDVPLLVPLARALGVTADLGINCLGALVLELQDGISPITACCSGGSACGRARCAPGRISSLCSAAGCGSRLQYLWKTLCCGASASGNRADKIFPAQIFKKPLTWHLVHPL